MYAEVGDRLVVGGDPERIGLIIDVPHGDGTPPYVVKWVATGHIAMVMPGQFGRVLRADQPTVPTPDHRALNGGTPDQSEAAWSGTKVCDSRGART